MYPLQICAASKNIHLITVAGCHRSLFWKYKLVLCSSEIWNWKLDTSIICTKEKLSKIWDLWSDGEGGKEKKEESSAASPGKGRNKQVQCPTSGGEGKGEKTLRDDSARLRLCRFPPRPLKDFSAISRLPPRAPLDTSPYLMGTRGAGAAPRTMQGLLSFGRRAQPPGHWGPQGNVGDAERSCLSLVIALPHTLILPSTTAL